MPWNDSSESRATSTGNVYVAPVGTALPGTATASLNAAFVGLGLITEEGISPTVTPEFQSYGALQSRQPVRRSLISLMAQASFVLEQWNEETLKFAMFGGTISSVSTGYKYTPPDGDDAIDERAMVIDILDGSTHDRWVFPRGNASAPVESTYQRNALALLPVTFEALAPADDPNGPPFYFYSDSADFAVGS